MDDTGTTSRNRTPEKTSPGNPRTGPGEKQRSQMRARTWAIAANYHDPMEYDIPKLPEWAVSRCDGTGLALAKSGEAEPFVRAEQPMKVRR